jgi:hypothetical protein
MPAYRAASQQLGARPSKDGKGGRVARSAFLVPSSQRGEAGAVAAEVPCLALHGYVCNRSPRRATPRPAAAPAPLCVVRHGNRLGHGARVDFRA